MMSSKLNWRYCSDVALFGVAFAKKNKQRLVIDGRDYF